jgi:nicotinamidase-related amidase
MAAPSANPSALATSYAASGFANPLGWGHSPALLLIDVCRAYWTPGSPLDCSADAHAAAVPGQIGRLLVCAREGGVPVVWTAVEYMDPDMADAGLFYKKARALRCFSVHDKRGLGGWLEGSGIDGSEGVAPREGEVVVKKQYASAFFGTSLASLLVSMGCDTVVIAGVSTSGCVRASGLDAMQSGFRPMVSYTSLCGGRGLSRGWV